MIILKRKLYASEEYYWGLGLDDAETDWLKKKRSKLAKKYSKKKQDILNDKKQTLDRKKLLSELKKDLGKAETAITENNILKEAVKHSYEKEKKELAKTAVRDVRKENYAKLFEDAEKSLAEKKALKRKALGKKGLIASSALLGIYAGKKAIDVHKNNVKKKKSKNSILKD